MAKKITALAQWYGGDRMICPEIAKQLVGCEWVGIPFAGGMSAIQAIQARTIVANDLHRGIINLAECVKSPARRMNLQAELRAKLFHPDTLWAAQQSLCPPPGIVRIEDPFLNAINYFVIAWMTRSGTCGTDSERTAGLSIRWEAGGGDSAKRYYAAIDALEEWGKHFTRCTFQCLDVFDFLAKVLDKLKHGLYLDPPFLGPGDKYSHKFGADKWARLAVALAKFKFTRVVIRCYDLPAMHKLFPEGQWVWHYVNGRTQTNAAAPEVLITNMRS